MRIESDRRLRVLASVGLAVGGLFGIAGTVVADTALRGLAWGIDGAALVMAGALLTVIFYRAGEDLVAAGFLVFTTGQGLILSTAAMDLVPGRPAFAAGISLWAIALVLVGTPPTFPLVVRVLGFAAGVLFGIVALQIFGGVLITATTSPLPFFAYPVLVATFIGWIWTLWRREA